MKITGTCPGCGATITRIWSQRRAEERGNQAIYCSMECRRSGETRTCEVCDKPFYRKACELRDKASRWCSRECADIGRRQGEHRTCRTCGKAFYTYPSTALKPGHDQFCSKACYDPHRGEKLRGQPKSDAHCLALHRALSTGNARNPYYGPRWYKICREIRERDGHTCQDCGKQRQPHERAYDVHHIVPRSEFGDDYAASNHPDNLITLCMSCHATRDNLLGRSHIPRKPRRKKVQAPT